MLIDDMANSINELNDSFVRNRRELHQHPELAFEEFWTSDYIADELTANGIDVSRGIGGTGILGILKGANKGKIVMLRAQMDGLAIGEVNGRSYGTLIEGYSHACGHDVNMALVLGAARILARYRDRFDGQVAFVFQPAEEPQLGARKMIDEGLFRRIEPDYVIAHHPMDNLSSGKVVAQTGPIWGSVDVLKLTIIGRKAELDAPHGGADAMLAAGNVLTSIYAITQRERPLQEPVVIRVVSVKGPIADPMKFEPSDQVLELVVRLTTYSSDVQNSMVKRLEEVVKGIVEAMQCKVTFENVHSLPPVINHPVPGQALVAGTIEAVGKDNLVQNWRNTFPEDFALFMQQYPGAVFGIGTMNPAKGIEGKFHEADYDIDEDSLSIGVEVTVRATLDLLDNR